ncbi:hypothetical protein SBY92_002007 [Candida maltosa Xu316]
MNFNLDHKKYLEKIKSNIFKKQQQQNQQQQQYPLPDSSLTTTTTSDFIDDDLSLVPITSPPDNPNQYPSHFFLSPVTSNESHNLYSDSPVDNTIRDQSPASSIVPVSKNTNDEGDDMIVDEEPHPEEEEEEPFSPLLSLPLEILYNILEYVYADNDISSINANLENFANTIPLLSKKFHHLSLCFLYKYTIFNRPHSFDKFLNNLLANPIIGKYVEFMDFQQFTSIGLGRTGRMNQEIQMVTYKTISKALSMTPNLLEFLASENIQDDLNVSVLDLLFNKLLKIKALDFCGASSELFANAFDELIITRDELSITKLSFHDCSNLSSDVFGKIFPHLVNLQRLDLNHTSITSSILLTLPSSIQLTHLSLARCSKLTTKDLINFLVNHPSVSHGSLTWLNLQIDSNVVSPLSDIYLLYTLKHLNAPYLKYLNIGGMPINYKILLTIKQKFPHLESLNISHAQISLDELTQTITPTSPDSSCCLKYLDLTGIKSLSKNISSFMKRIPSNIEAIEYDYKLLYDNTGNGNHIKIQPLQTSYIEEMAPPMTWKFYDNEGRRCWIYKTDNNIDIDTISDKGGCVGSNLVFYDLETGNKIVNTVKKPVFLKYASRKINCSIGYYNLNGYKSKKLKKKSVIEGDGNGNGESCWPVEFSQRGIYNYYSLNVK